MPDASGRFLGIAVKRSPQDPPAPRRVLPACTCPGSRRPPAYHRPGCPMGDAVKGDPRVRW